jgi:mRNA interferase MazF
MTPTSSTPARRPSRGEIWNVTLDPTVGHEQGGTRPCLVVSSDHLKYGGAGIVVIAPITRTRQSVALHVTIHTPEGGVTADGDIKIEHTHSLRIDRLQRYRGTVGSQTMTQVETKLRLLLGL